MGKKIKTIAVVVQRYRLCREPEIVMILTGEDRALPGFGSGSGVIMNGVKMRLRKEHDPVLHAKATYRVTFMYVNESNGFISQGYLHFEENGDITSVLEKE